MLFLVLHKKPIRTLQTLHRCNEDGQFISWDSRRELRKTIVGDCLWLSYDCPCYHSTYGVHRPEETAEGGQFTELHRKRDRLGEADLQLQIFWIILGFCRFSDKMWLEKAETIRKDLEKISSKRPHGPFQLAHPWKEIAPPNGLRSTVPFTVCVCANRDSNPPRWEVELLVWAWLFCWSLELNLDAKGKWQTCSKPKYQ